jgi:15-cis-phytoene synthase
MMQSPTMTGDEQTLRQSRKILANNSRTFRRASLLLAPECRDEAALLYAFCRLVDDAVDEASGPQQASRQIEDIRDQLDGHAPAGTVVGGFLELAKARGIELSWARQLVAGVASDVGGVRVEDKAELLRYCYRVAGTVGLMMCPVLGVDDPRAWPFAVDLGIAMQLTNICRDVLEDARDGRVYLPATSLQRAGLSAEQVLDETANARALAAVVDELLEEAERYYRSGRSGMGFIPPRSRLAILIASRMYRGIGVRLRFRHGSNPMHGRTVVPWWEQSKSLARAAVHFLVDPVVAGRGAVTHDSQLHAHLAGLPGVAEVAEVAETAEAVKAQRAEHWTRTI